MITIWGEALDHIRVFNMFYIISLEKSTFQKVSGAWQLTVNVQNPHHSVTMAMTPWQCNTFVPYCMAKDFTMVMGPQCFGSRSSGAHTEQITKTGQKWSIRNIYMKITEHPVPTSILCSIETPYICAVGAGGTRSTCMVSMVLIAACQLSSLIYMYLSIM